MRKPYIGYEMFTSEQQPKYKKTFLEWFSENSVVNGVDILKTLQSNNMYYVEAEHFPGYETMEEDYSTCFRDHFSKKLQLCQNVIGVLTNNGNKYDFDKVADIMDLYEDVINEVSMNENVLVTTLPSGKTRTFAFATEQHIFHNLTALKETFQTGVNIIYYFTIMDDFSIVVRWHKRELLTRRVLVEKE